MTTTAPIDDYEWPPPAAPSPAAPSPAAPSPGLIRPAAPSPGLIRPAPYVTGPAPSWAQPLVPPSVVSPAVGAWLDDQERHLTHPAVVAERLRRSGWAPEAAHLEAIRYRRRFNEHPLGYGCLLVATGVAALALGSLGHALAARSQGPVDRNTVGLWLTALLISAPFAIWAHIWAARVDRDDPVAVWSEPRRSLAAALVWACGVVGMLRLVYYGGKLVGVLVGASWSATTSLADGLINVAVTVSIALPLGLWAYYFLHRFDSEDPSRPAAMRQRRRAL